VEKLAKWLMQHYMMTNLDIHLGQSRKLYLSSMDS
jgi:hypothetical protein